MDDLKYFLSQNLHECLATTQQILVYIHLFAFAFAIVTILNEDVKILISKKINVPELHRVASKITYLLAILWITGIALLSIKPGLDLNLILANPKLAAKITIVVILTANGVLLHYLVFPNFSSQDKARKIILTACVLTAISTTSWIFAGLIGAARAVAPMMSYQHYIVIYMAALVFAFLVSLIIVYPIMRIAIKSLDSGAQPNRDPSNTGSLSGTRVNLPDTYGQCPHSLRRAAARVGRGSDIRTAILERDI